MQRTKKVKVYRIAIRLKEGKGKTRQSPLDASRCRSTLTTLCLAFCSFVHRHTCAYFQHVLSKAVSTIELVANRYACLCHFAGGNVLIKTRQHFHNCETRAEMCHLLRYSTRI